MFQWIYVRIVQSSEGILPLIIIDEPSKHLNKDTFVLIIILGSFNFRNNAS